MSGDNIFLSIVIPFHNSAGKCDRLIATLMRLPPWEDVEILFVDDGSTDSTPAILEDAAARIAVPTLHLPQARGGPGSARNRGLDQARGRFVWFVDSDDDFMIDSIARARAMSLDDVDVILWGFDHPYIERQIRPGLYRPQGPAPPDIFDPIVANWFSRDFLRRTAMRFPENCFYEATALEAFILPLIVENFLVSEVTAYDARMDHPSVTRTASCPSPAQVDRLATLPLGMQFVRQAGLPPQERAPFDSAFVRLFLWNSFRLSKFPDRSWIFALRVMRQFRKEAANFEIAVDPFETFPGRTLTRRLARFLWLLSYALPPQDRHFERRHLCHWNRAIGWRPPASPSPLRAARKAAV